MKEDNVRAMDKLIANGTPAFRIQLTNSGFNVQRLVNGSYKDLAFFYDTDLLEDQKNWVEEANLEIMECTRRMIDMSNTEAKVKCTLCNKEGQYRYAPYDGANNWPEGDRWRCDEHKPYEATEKGWNGEWDKHETKDLQSL